MIFGANGVEIVNSSKNDVTCLKYKIEDSICLGAHTTRGAMAVGSCDGCMPRRAGNRGAVVARLS